jgi:uncharacterized protein (TIGR02001 family)
MRQALLLCALLASAGIAQADEPQAFAGATLTTNYLVDGLTQTQDGPAFQPYLEVEFPPGFYVGAWVSNVDFGDDTDSLETDLYVGFRGTAAGVNYDVKYYRYYYDETGYCCGEIEAIAEFPIVGPLMGSAGYYSYLNSNYAVSAGLGLELPGEFVLSGLYKTDTIENTWDVGISRYITDTIWADLRYYDASYADPTTVVSLNWDTDWESVFAEK